MTIISQIKLNGKWVNQSEVPEAAARKIIRAALYKGMEEIRFYPDKKKEEKTA